MKRGFVKILLVLFFQSGLGKMLLLHYSIEKPSVILYLFGPSPFFWTEIEKNRCMGSFVGEEGIREGLRRQL